MAERENIRSRLKKHQLTQVWLINQLGLRGIVTDKTEMSSVLAGTRSGSKADAIIELSHDILDKYEEGSVLVNIAYVRLLKNGVRSSPFSLVLGRISKPLPGISGVKFPLQSLESGAVLRLKLLKLGRD